MASLISLLRGPEKNPNDYYGYDARKLSLGVVVSDGHDGMLLWYVGGYLALEVEEYGFRHLSDLGLDDAPAGISIWEGKYVWSSGWNPAMGIDEGGDANPRGKFRSPTDDEWEAIRSGKCPWNEDEWRLVETPA